MENIKDLIGKPLQKNGMYFKIVEVPEPRRYFDKNGVEHRVILEITEKVVLSGEDEIDLMKKLDYLIRNK